MIRALESLLIGTKSAKKLSGFYSEKVGLESGESFEFGENKEELYEFKFGKGPNIYIMDHSKVGGKNKNPEQVIFNLEVDDIKKEAARLKKAKVKLVQDTYHVEGYGYIATFEDIDGNYFQLVQVRGKVAR